jgi:hypothetical protein
LSKIDQYRSVTKPSRETFKKNRLINSIKNSRQVKKSVISNLLKTDSLKELVMIHEEIEEQFQ